MHLPTLQWLRIVRYGDFHDVPRSILALDREMVFWLFYGGFDDEIDDYPDHLQVYRIGHDAAAARDAFGMRDASGNVQGFEVVDTVLLSRIEFDPTCRNAMFMHMGPAYPKESASVAL